MASARYSVTFSALPEQLEVVASYDGRGLRGPGLKITPRGGEAFEVGVHGRSDYDIVGALVYDIQQLLTSAVPEQLIDALVDWSPLDQPGNAYSWTKISTAPSIRVLVVEEKRLPRILGALDRVEGESVSLIAEGIRMRTATPVYIVVTNARLVLGDMHYSVTFSALPEQLEAIESDDSRGG